MMDKHGANLHALAFPELYVDLSAAEYSRDFPTFQLPYTAIISRLTHNLTIR